MNSFRLVVLSVVIALILASCATRGPSIFRAYEGDSAREQIAIVSVYGPDAPTIVQCDGKPVPQSARYLLLQPGRHELMFVVSGQTLFVTYSMRGKKYLEAAPGHTYVLKSEAGSFVVGDKWFPEVIDVTEDSELHLRELPAEDVQTP